MRYILTLCLVTWLFSGGCSVKNIAQDQFVQIKHYTQGEFYLSQQKYQDGLATFKKEVDQHPEDPEANYYLGRFYLADGQARRSIDHLRIAIENDPSDASYYFWAGVANAELKNPELEQSYYEKALNLDPDHVGALTYLGHNRLEDGDYEKALSLYTRALSLTPDHPQILYNRALILKRLDRTPEEIDAWKAYLDRFPSGAFARNAVNHLNEQGDFSFRNILIGRRMVTVQKIHFHPFSSDLLKSSNTPLGFVGELVSSDTGMILHVVAYQKNNVSLAKSRAQSIKTFLLKKYPEFKSERIKLSWFGQPEIIIAGEKRFTIDSEIKLFAQKRPTT
jgi:tetratricopeptide (TPR) repeat protein